MYISSRIESEEQLKKKLDFIYQESKKGKGFHGIWELAFHPITIITAIHNIKSNQGAQTPGIDRETMNKYLQTPHEEVIRIVQENAKHYKPKPVRRVYIPKGNGKKRPLGIPSILDRIIQECIRIVIEPIAEAKFYPHSYGFRPYRACKHAIKDITNIINANSLTPPVWAIEGDIKGCFDNINHRLLLRKCYKIGIHDKRILMIIKQMLKAGYVERDILYSTDVGTPQGGIISPLLMNIYLNSFDWTIGRMYHEPQQKCQEQSNNRRRLRRQGIAPKYLVRYADDWIILTTSEQEAQKLLKYLKKYFKHRLKLELSEDKTIITNIQAKHAKFLGFLIKAGYPRTSKIDSRQARLVGKPYPDHSKVKEQVRKINKEIRALKKIPEDELKAVKIEEINAQIIGITEYWKTGICSNTFRYIDDKVNRCLLRTFKKLYHRSYREHIVELDKLSNRRNRHKGYRTKTFAVKVGKQYIGITRAFLTHSQWEKYPFNQKMTPYTEEGRTIYLKQSKKKLPKDRPPLYDIPALYHSLKQELYNFEYMMNREYAFNRDQGRCRICEIQLIKDNRHCHHIDSKLPNEEINKVFNLAWLCRKCHSLVHGSEVPEGFNGRMLTKLNKFKEKIASGQ